MSESRRQHKDKNNIKEKKKKERDVYDCRDDHQLSLLQRGGMGREGPGEKRKHCYGFFFIDYPHPPHPLRPSSSSLQTQCNVKWCTCYLFPFPFLVEREKRQLCVSFTTLWGVILDLKKQNTVCADIYTKTHTFE